MDSTYILKNKNIVGLIKNLKNISNVFTAVVRREIWWRISQWDSVIKPR